MIITKPIVFDKPMLAHIPTWGGIVECLIFTSLSLVILSFKTNKGMILGAY